MDTETSGKRIAVLSGKGGTGKTFLTVNLAAVAGPSVYIDCDVEEPNGHLFFQPEEVTEEAVTVPVPEVNAALCTGCRQCVDFCRFHALAFAKQLKVFDDVCHACGGCLLVCPEQALTEREKTVGVIRKGRARDVTVRTGIMHIGEASGIPIIRELLEHTDSRPQFIDCPPGSACGVMESIKDADYCLIAAEPTTFGVHNLHMVYELVQLFAKPFGVVLNKVVEEDNPAERFCRKHDIPVLDRIPYDGALGKINADGRIAVVADDAHRARFATLWERIQEEVRREAAAYS